MNETVAELPIHTTDRARFVGEYRWTYVERLARFVANYSTVIGGRAINTSSGELPIVDIVFEYVDNGAALLSALTPSEPIDTLKI
jgi:hypothetical protein